MNILLCGGTFDVISGYNLVIRRLAAEFKALGHKVLILCRKPPAALYPGERAEDFLSVRAIGLLPGLRTRTNHRLAAFRPDVAFAHNFDVTDLTGLRYARRRGIPTFLMCHTKYRHYLRLAVPWKRLRLRFIGWIFERWVFGRLRKTDIVFALTEEMREYLRTSGLKRLEVVSSGVDREALKPEAGAPPKVLNPKEIRLLFVGQIREMKNQMFLLEMTRFLPESFHLDLVGGKSWDRRYYRKFLKAVRRGGYPRVEWHGELPPGETAAFFRRADLFVNASLIEVQNLSQLEAFVAGLPTVRLIGPLTGGVTVHGETAVHLDENVSPHAFAEAVVRLVEDRALFGRIRAGALAEGEKYSWRTSAERILGIFEETARARSRAALAREGEAAAHEGQKAVAERE